MMMDINMPDNDDDGYKYRECLMMMDISIGNV